MDGIATVVLKWTKFRQMMGDSNESTYKYIYGVCVCLPLTTAAKSLSIELDDGFIDDSRYSMLKLFSFESGYRN